MRALPNEHERVQAAVLNMVLDHAPHLLTEAELIAEITANTTDFAEHDDTRSAIRDLVASGVLHRVGERFIQASLPARRACQLLQRL